MCDTPSHGSDHLWLIWKESIQNCRCYGADTAAGTDGRTDGRTDRRTEWNQYTPQQLIHSQTGCNRWSLGMDKWFHPTLYNGCNYLSMLGLKWIQVSKGAPGNGICQTTTKQRTTKPCAYLMIKVVSRKMRLKGFQFCLLTIQAAPPFFPLTYIYVTGKSHHSHNRNISPCITVAHFLKFACKKIDDMQALQVYRSQW